MLFRSWAAKLANLREPVRQLERMRRDLTASEQKLRQAEESLARLQAEQKEDLRQLEARRQQLASDMQLAAGHQGNVLAARQAADHVRLRKELDTAASARATAEKSQRERAEQEKRGIELLAKAKRELESLREAHIAGQAGVLARDLAPGKPCPVCGSIEHPRPAEAGDQIPSKEQVAAKQKELERIEKGLEDVRAILRSAGDAAATARAVEAERATALGEAAALPPSVLEAAFLEKQSAAQASEDRKSVV